MIPCYAKEKKEKEMKILITNDDGANAAQLIPLIKACQKWGDVTVVVPKCEQSAKSHSIEIRSAFEIRQVKPEPDITMWTVDSSPADCIRFAVSGLNMQFDLVISGINRGYNLGKDIMYSGTMAAATEAVCKGMKAIAVSTSTKYYDHALDHLEAILQFLDGNKLWEINSLYNVNIPVQPKGIRITRVGGAAFREAFIPIGDDMYFPGGKPLITDGSDLSRDTDAAALGYISITPMTIDRTSIDAYEKLKHLNQ